MRSCPSAAAFAVSQYSPWSAANEASVAAAGASGSAAPKIDSEGELPLELAAAGREHAGAVLLGGRPELRQQPGLPDAGRSLDESEPALAPRRLGQGGPKRLELAIALQQELCPSGVRHGGNPKYGDVSVYLP